MVNWNRRLLIQGVTTVIMVNVRALGHCFGVSSSIKGFKSAVNKQDLAERLKLWFIQMRAFVYTGWYQGLPQVGPAPLVHIEVVAGTQTLTLHSEVHADTDTVYTTIYILYTDYYAGYIHPEMNKHLGLQYALGGLSPLTNVMKCKQHCTKVHTAAYTLSRPGLWIVLMTS